MKHRRVMWRRYCRYWYLLKLFRTCFFVNSTLVCYCDMLLTNDSCVSDVLSRVMWRGAPRGLGMGYKAGMGCAREWVWLGYRIPMTISPVSCTDGTFGHRKIH